VFSETQKVAWFQILRALPRPPREHYLQQEVDA